jgi:hypothetical protein
MFILILAPLDWVTASTSGSELALQYPTPDTPTPVPPTATTVGPTATAVNTPVATVQATVTPVFPTPWPVPGPVYTNIPTISIVSVVADTSVTIRTNNFPANQTFTARMGAMGTRGIGGIVVGTTNSGAGGTFLVTYEVPAALRGSAQIAIRLESPQGFYSYNWFYNSGSAVATPGAGTPSAPPVPGYTGIPTFSIVSTIGGQSVTIRTNNFPPSQTFTVRMGAMGTRGVGGTVVGTTESGAGGIFVVTYTIPEGLRSASQIAIRLESPQGYYAYNWFYNSTAGGDGTTPATPVPPAPIYTGIPTFSVVRVVGDTSITIRTNNFPANQSFTATMGAMGTRGVGGVVVGATQSGVGGAFDVTYEIPASLRGTGQIAIRLESPQGYFAYNWFYNSTSP